MYHPVAIELPPETRRLIIPGATSVYGNCHSVYGNCQENGVDPNEFVQARRFSCVTLDGSGECGGAS